ncbi:hypothetical protein BZA05DRAFT_397022 [Tricharina praecox]|uniref:uncharacterized protein n=1 Tax=Tricharina praecox TaxID=43433 RepID=UPI00222003CE|nr:uncharacterized protein BZA05DRAFT_397022 [Tricharina praecox]KAI5852158.1 hypothetical protein BZA05DRAFT_397022 [Tricharina praecox]
MGAVGTGRLFLIRSCLLCYKASCVFLRCTAACTRLMGEDSYLPTELKWRYWMVTWLWLLVEVVEDVEVVVEVVDTVQSAPLLNDMKDAKSGRRETVLLLLLLNFTSLRCRSGGG